MFKFFTSDLRRNLTKILCLTAGMAIGFLLVAKIYFEQTYDAFFPDSDRLYYVTESVEIMGEYKEYPQTPGAIAPGLHRYAPIVEAATRYTGLTDNIRVKTDDDDRLFDAEAILIADSCFFDVLSTPIIAGDPHEALAVAHSCMISRSLAEKIGGDVIGKQLSSPDFSYDYSITVNGVYEDFPANSTIGNCIYLSMPSFDSFLPGSRYRWMGNDRYHSFVKLIDGASPDDLQPYVDRMLSENIDNETLKMSHFNIGIKPLTSKYANDTSVRNMVWILSLLAVVMLMSAGLNYLLIVIGQMGRRSKEMAVRKCYGTGNLRLFGRIMGESLFFLIVSLALAVFLVFSFSGLCLDLLGETPGELLTIRGVWVVEVAVCLVLLIITGAVPAWMYCRTPVANAFRSNVKSRRAWKLILLSVQFFASGLLVCLLSLVGRQYSLLTNADMGFDYENLATVSIQSVPRANRSAIVEEIKRLGCVDDVTSSDHDFISNCSGNNVWLGNDQERTVNIADMYYSNRNIFDVMGISLSQGTTFYPSADSASYQVIVEEKFTDVLSKITGVDDTDLVGKSFNITGHDNFDGSMEFTICGVMGNTRRGGFNTDRADSRAGVMFFSPYIQQNLFIRFTQLTPEALHSVQQIIDNMCPGKDLYVTPMKTRVAALADTVKRFGTSVIIAGLSILLITMIGLIGYTTDEVQRRAREIAIRKVSGTSAREILRLFCIDILKVALPSVILGGIVAVIIARRWLSQFTEQVSLSPLMLGACIIGILALLLAVVAINCLSVARSNPVDHLRSE